MRIPAKGEQPLKTQLQNRVSSMKGELKSWEPRYKAISQYICPNRGRFSGDRTNDGARKDIYQIDGTPWQSVRTMASGMQGGLTSPGRPWFKVGTPVDRDLRSYRPVSLWLENLEHAMYAIFNASYIYNSYYGIYEEIGSFGIGSMFIGSHRQNVIRSKTYTAGEYSIALGADYTPDAFMLEFRLQVWQVIQEYGLENVTDQIKVKYNNHQFDEWVDIIWVIEANPEYNDLMLQSSNNMRYRSYHYEVGSSPEEFLRVSGFRSFPIMAPRWGVVSNDIMGSGNPGMMALGVSKMLQKLSEKGLIALDKMIDPPMKASALSKNSRPSLIPGSVTIMDVDRGVYEPVMNIAPNFADLEAKAEQMRQFIQRCFFNDLFMMLASQNLKYMTAQEVAERHEEKLVMLGPVLERLYAELLNPSIERTFDIMMEADMLPPPPPELQGMEIDIEYISILAQAQKMIGTKGLEQFTQFAGGVLSVFPDAALVVDPEVLLRKYANWLGIPVEIVRDEEVIQAMREQIQAQQQQQQMMESSSVMAQNAKVMSETDTSKSSMLKALLGNITG